jgi:hypothetical protein
MNLRRLCITALVGINALLAVTLVSLMYQPAEAQAQRGRGGGQYAVVTAEFTAGTDAVFMLNTSSGELAALVPNVNGQLQPADLRDISSDF